MQLTNPGSSIPSCPSNISREQIPTICSSCLILSARDPSLFCLISVKLLSYIILERITPYAENIIGDYDYQGGFRPNRSVTDQVFTLRMHLSKYYETSKSVHQVFLDFRQAYDSINRKSLWFALWSLLEYPKNLMYNYVGLQ